jgi:putative sigma-54 modulation protein
MKMVFTFKRLDRSEALEEYARHRIAEISQFLLKEGFGQIYFSKVRNIFYAEVKVNSREKIFQSSDLEIWMPIQRLIKL